MRIITLFILIILSAIVLIPFVRVQWKGIITVATVIVIAILSSILAFHSLAGESFEYVFQGSLVTGKIPDTHRRIIRLVYFNHQFHFHHRSFLWFTIYEGVPLSKIQSVSSLHQLYIGAIKPDCHLLSTKHNSLFSCLGNNGFIFFYTDNF